MKIKEQNIIIVLLVLATLIFIPKKVDVSNQESTVNLEYEIESQMDGKEDIRRLLIGRGASRRILIGGDHCLEYSLTGTTFQGRKTTLRMDKIKMCHLKTFGPNLTEECRKEFFDLNNNLEVMLRSPSLMWFKGDLIMTLRIRISSLSDRFPGKFPRDCFGLPCNHIYLRRYNCYLNPVGPKDIITLRAPIEDNHKERTGPHDPRLFQINNTMYSLFATGYYFSWISGIWDYKKQRHYIPEFQKYLYLKGETIFEKNWAPLVIEDELYIIRHLDPLQIMKCKIHENCTFVKNNTDALQFKMDDRKIPLRGGTAFEPYKHPYYIGLGHGTYHEKSNSYYRHYKAHLIVLCVDPFKIVYVSDPLKLHPVLYARYTGPSIWDAVKGNFIFPTGLLVENEDSIVIGAHINDKASLLLRMEGIQRLVDNILSVDNGTRYQNNEISIQNYMLKRGEFLHFTSTS